MSEELQELIAERDSLQRRIASMLREERIESYAAVAVGAALSLLALWGAATGALSWALALVIVIVIAGLTAIAVHLIRTYGLNTLLNYFGPDATNDFDDPLDDLRQRLATCEQKISRLRGGAR